MAREYPKKRILVNGDLLQLTNQTGRFQLTYYQAGWFNGEQRYTIRWRRTWSKTQENEANEMFRSEQNV